MGLASIQDHFSTIIYRTAASYHISRMMTQQTVQLWKKKSKKPNNLVYYKIYVLSWGSVDAGNELLTKKYFTEVFFDLWFRGGGMQLHSIRRQLEGNVSFKDKHLKSLLHDS